MKKRLSLKHRVAINAVVFMGILTALIAAIGCTFYVNNVKESYIEYADTVLKYAYEEASDHDFGDMIADRTMPKGYEELRERLNRIKENSSIEYLYAVYFEDPEDIHSLRYAINTRTKDEIQTAQRAGKSLSEIYTYMGVPCEDGSFEDDTLAILQNAVKTKKPDSGTLEGYSTVYGHMLNGYHVVFDSNGDAAGLICVEIDTNRIYDNVRRFMGSVVLIAIILTALIIILYVIYTRHYLISPILKIVRNSDSFVGKMKAGAAPEELVYEPVELKTGGELELLADNVKSLADGVSSYTAHLKSVTAEKERIGTELSLATRIQASMLPGIFPAFPERSEFDIYASMTPAKEVGGDFYDFFLTDDDHLCILIADVSGKGVPAALFMMASKIIIANNAMSGKSPAKILEDTNDAICPSNREEMFVTVWLGIIELSTGKLTASSAGHEYPAIRFGNGSFDLYKDKHGFVIGSVAGLKYTEYELMLTPGSKVFLYTDGVTDATDKDRELFGKDRMLLALNKDPAATTRQLLDNVTSAIDGFVKDADQFDDCTMLCVEYRGKQ